LGVAALVAAGLVASSFAGAARAADQLLSGTIASASGEKLGGVTVSAKAQGTTITTSVYTDDKGDYYFPPLPAGKYNVWAQALAFETAKGEVDLTAARRADLTLEPMTDAERRVRQLRAPEVAAELRHHLGRRVAILVRGGRCQEVARVGEAVGADGTEIRKPQRRAVVLAHVAARRFARDPDRELDTTRDNGDLTRAHGQAAELGLER
jgi:hypothetical protein